MNCICCLCNRNQRITRTIRLYRLYIRNSYSNAQTLLTNGEYVLTRLNAVLDQMPSAALPASRLFERRSAPLAGDSERNASVGLCSGLATNAVGDFVSASGTQLQLRTRKDTELYEICYFSLQKLPRTYSKVCRFDALYQPLVIL